MYSFERCKNQEISFTKSKSTAVAQTFVLARYLRTAHIEDLAICIKFALLPHYLGRCDLTGIAGAGSRPTLAAGHALAKTRTTDCDHGITSL